MNAAFERRVLEAFDEAVLWTDVERERRLGELETSEPALAARVRALIAADDEAASALPTIPSAPIASDRADTAFDLPPPERVSVYRITGLLGEGGMGTVWRGERDDGLFAQSVAVKLMRPGLLAASAMAQFHAERRLLARLRHPNIAQLFDGGTDRAGRAYFIMELVEGTPLTDFARAEKLDLRGCVPLMEAVCAAVQHAHGGLVVHADIKPSNILVDREGRAKLLDFGIARGLDAGDEDVSGFGLTPAYASPQRRAGAAPVLVDDVYALGAVLHELACGEPPGATPPRSLGAATPSEFAAIVAKATAADPSARYESATALARDLRRWADGFPVQALPQNRWRSAQLLVRRRPFASAAAALAGAGLAVAFAVITTLYLRAEAERREADARFEQARGMAHYMLFDVFERLSDTPGTLPMRRALADRARIYLDELSAAPRAPASVRAEAAIGLMQMAGVEGLFSAGQLGERARAEDSLAQADRILAAPASSADERDPRWIYAEGRLKLFQGLHAFDEGSGAAAEPLLRAAVDGLERARTLLPQDAEVAADLWQARLFLADVLGGEGAYRDAVALIAEAVQSYDRDREFLRAHETTPLLLARSYKLVGRTKLILGSAGAAETDFAEAERLLVAEDALHPRRTRTLMELLDVRWDLAGSRLEQGRTAEARATVEAALALANARLALEPDHDGLQRMLSLLDAQHAGILGALGLKSEARDAALASLKARERRHTARPDDGVAWREYLSSLRVAGEAQAGAGEAAAACTHFRGARSGYDAYLARYPDASAFVLTQALALDDRLAAC